MTEKNKRGTHWYEAGKQELSLSEKYGKNVEGLQEQYPRCADIYYTLSDIYKHEAKPERERAEYKW